MGFGISWQLGTVYFAFYFFWPASGGFFLADWKAFLMSYF